ncbi:hypothetical protein ACFXJ8_23480 [Nonomuraea sp. NPDC059194]|uniref:hypothetical protein n=1 Tax=Nonomuraea sp. NPDC059194 TaxID=3346764 RepID=UPI003685BE4A
MNASTKLGRTATASVILALVAGFVTVTAGPSSAEVPGRVIVSESSDSNSNDKGAEVTCPDGKRVIGTGAEITGWLGGSVIIDEVIPTTYSVSAYGVETPDGTTASWTITVWAVCGFPRGTTYIRSVATTSHPNPKTLPLECLEDDWLLGSGYQLEGARGNVSVTGLVPTLNSVFVETKENHRGYAGNYYLRAFVICADNAPTGLQVVYEESDEDSEDKGSIAPCPSGKETLSAGFSIPGAAGETVLTYFIPTNGTALGYANELSVTGRDWSVKTYATCAFE